MNKLKLLIPVLLLVVLFITLPAAATEKADTMTVYVDQTSGADTNDGLAEATAVKTLDKAYKLLSVKFSSSSL